MVFQWHPHTQTQTDAYTQTHTHTNQHTRTHTMMPATTFAGVVAVFLKRYHDFVKGLISLFCWCFSGTFNSAWVVIKQNVLIKTKTFFISRNADFLGYCFLKFLHD